MVRARAEAALFGDVPAPVKVGRFTILERAGAGGMGVVWSAWDPELNRGVALKLATAGDSQARARARDEGQALAKLSHPHVVPIYDVLDAPEGVFLVIELVRGKTLREYAKEGSVAAIVRAYRQAGEGLAAAHAEGLVHRDFKPDNAIVGADGRVRVLDFGLAHADGSDEATGGTARYMAPEQRDHRAITAAVDQFALCVSLREGLGDKVPRWIEPILRRGTDADPAKRFPSMTALIHALGLDPATRWRRRALVGVGVVGLATTAIAFSIGKRQQAVDPCEGAAETIAPSWGPVRQAAATVHFAGLSTYARETAPRIAANLDGYATAWASLHQASCQAHQRGELSPSSFDRRLACLAIRSAALAKVGDLLTSVSSEGVPDLVIAAGNLPELAMCGRDDLLLSPVEPPPLPQVQEAAAIAALIAQVDVQRDAGKIEPATRDADVALRRARALNYTPLIARAEVARGRIDLALARDDRGAAIFHAAMLRAIRAHDEPLAVEAFARGSWAASTTAQPRDATDGLALIEAITERIGDREPFVRALLHNNLGGIALARGDRPAARVAFERARGEAARLSGPGAIELTVVLLNLLVVTEDPVRQAALGRELTEIRTRLLGAQHPSTLEARILSPVLIDTPRAREQLKAPCFELRELHPDHRELIGECMYYLSWMAVADDDRATMETAVAAGLTAYPVEEERRDLLAALRTIHDAPEAALAVLARRPALAADAPVWSINNAIDAAIVAGFAHRTLRDSAAVERDRARGRELLSKIVTKDSAVEIHRRQRLLDKL
jgi:hypothetical protein